MGTCLEFAQILVTFSSPLVDWTRPKYVESKVSNYLLLPLFSISRRLSFTLTLTAWSSLYVLLHSSMPVFLLLQFVSSHQCQRYWAFMTSSTFWANSSYTRGWKTPRTLWLVLIRNWIKSHWILLDHSVPRREEHWLYRVKICRASI